MKILEMTEKSIMQSVKSRKLTLSVVVQGRTGLPMALRFAEAGCQVIGADTDKEKIACLNKGNVHIKETRGRNLT